MSTIKDVANAAGVSVATVSRAFDGNADKVSEKTRAIIYAAAQKLQYHPNLLARGLKCARTGMVGFIVPSLENTFYHTVLRHVEEALGKEGYRMLVSFLSEGRDCSAALAAMEASRVDAVLLCAVDRREEARLASLSKSTRIIQLFNAAYPEYDSLVMDDKAGAEAATRYLLNRGHRRILYLGGNDRIEGYFRAFAAAGLSVPEDTLQVREYSSSTETILSSLHTSGATAALGISRQGYRLMRALREARISVPRDLSLLVYDDSEWAQMMGISAICHPHEEIASRIASHIAALLRDSETASASGGKPLWKEVLSPYLTERESVSSIDCR